MNSEKTTRGRNRRRMAWLSLIFMMLVVLLCLFAVPVSKLTVLSDLLSWFFAIMASIVCAYMGASAMEYVKVNNPKAKANKKIEPIDD